MMVRFCLDGTEDFVRNTTIRFMGQPPRVGEIIWFEEDEEAAHYEVEEVGYAIPGLIKPERHMAEPYAVVYIKRTERLLRSDDPGWLEEKEWFNSTLGLRIARMRSDPRVHVEVQETERRIKITMTGTPYAREYVLTADGLLPQSAWVQDDPDAQMTGENFAKCADALAEQKGMELGWIK